MRKAGEGPASPPAWVYFAAAFPGSAVQLLHHALDGSQQLLVRVVGPRGDLGADASDEAVANALVPGGLAGGAAGLPWSLAGHDSGQAGRLPGRALAGNALLKAKRGVAVHALSLPCPMASAILAG